MREATLSLNPHVRSRVEPQPTQVSMKLAFWSLGPHAHEAWSLTQSPHAHGARALIIRLETLNMHEA